MTAPALKPRLKYRLKIISGPHQNEIHTLDKDMVKIGRGDDNTIQLPRDARISRNHVEILWTGAEFKVKNLSQKNFVMVNEKVVQIETIKPGSKIQIGETLIEVFEDGPILVLKAGEAVAPNGPAYAPPDAVAEVRAAINTKANPATPANSRPHPPSTSAYSTPAVPRSQSAAMPSRAKAAPRPFRPAASGGKAKFYYVVMAVIGLVVWLANQDSKPKEKLTFRTSQQVEYDRLQVESEKLKLEERINSQSNQIIRQAQENMVKGMRDFQQANYMRAREHFASVLIKDPDNELAKRYYHLSGIKFDELLQFHILHEFHKFTRSSTF